jgi:type IV pilus assembly protein PilQ
MILMTAVALAASGAPAQQVRPAPGGPVRTLQDLITITSDTPFDQALIMIQQASGLVIVDPGNRRQPIGIDVDRQPWRLALDMIANAHDLKVVKGPGYYMLSPRSETPSAPGLGAPVEEPKRPEITADSREVNIAAVFFEADRQTLRELGINWNSLRAGRVEVNASNVAADLVSEPALSVQATGHLARNLSVDALLKALESRSAGEVISNPQIKVIGGKEGLIQVGQDFSVVTRDFAGNATVEFFKTGTILKVTPAIVTEDTVEFVHLKVEAERSSLIDPARGIINRTTANTSALLFDGEEAAIAGLYVNEVSKVRSGVPLLKDLPTWFFGLRYLFGFDRHEVGKKELVVLLRVNIVPSVRQRIQEKLRQRRWMDLIEERSQEFQEILREREKRQGPGAGGQGDKGSEEQGTEKK